MKLVACRIRNISFKIDKPSFTLLNIIWNNTIWVLGGFAIMYNSNFSCQAQLPVWNPPWPHIVSIIMQSIFPIGKRSNYMMSQSISDSTCCATQSSLLEPDFFDPRLQLQLNFDPLYFASNGRVTSVTRCGAEDAGAVILITRNLYK